MTQQTVQQRQKQSIEQSDGIIAALDQSGGSIAIALEQYGVTSDMCGTQAEMLAEIHEMRGRILTAPAFSSENICGAIIFRESLLCEVQSKPIPQMLWEDRGIVPFLKIDDGLDERADDVQLLKPIPDLTERLKIAREAGIFGTKMRSLIHEANPKGIQAIVSQQFQLGKEIIAAGLVPIIEPEVSIVSRTKRAAEDVLLAALAQEINRLTEDQQIILKLSIPEQIGFYADLAAHANVLRVAALSGGYSQDDACKKLAQQPQMIASFSRALLEGLRKQQSDATFNTQLAATISRLKACGMG